MWALGGSSVLVKQALASLFVPGRRKQEFVPDAGLFAKDFSLRKGVLATGGVCVLAALLFFAAAPFRQAFGVALKPWLYVYQLASRNFTPGIENLAKQAEVRHDPEGLAFCAVRLDDPRESARLADEAVRLDPNLIWVYAVVALHHPGFPETGLRMEKLERWDPHNALFPLITAVLRCHGKLVHGIWSPQTPEQEQAWQSVMGAAFQSTKFDDYLDRFAQLNRRVVPRYGFYDPYEVQSREGFNISPIAVEISKWYANLLIQAGADLDARGDRKGGREKYWTVARFGQLLDSQGRTGAEHWVGTTLQAMAYSQLQVSAGKEGNQEEAALFGYLAAKFDPGKPVRGESPWIPRQSAFGWDVARRSATVVEISGLMILIFAGLVVMAVSTLIAGSRRGAWPRRATRQAGGDMAHIDQRRGIIVLLRHALPDLWALLEYSPKRHCKWGQTSNARPARFPEFDHDVARRCAP